MGILPGSGPLGSGPTGPGSGFSVMPHQSVFFIIGACQYHRVFSERPDFPHKRCIFLWFFPFSVGNI